MFHSYPHEINIDLTHLYMIT